MSQQPSTTIKVPKAGELVANLLRRRIIKGDIKPGDPLPSENELMAIFNVSRPTLREALRILDSESLITVARGARGGARANLPDVDVTARYATIYLQAHGTTFHDLHKARAIIEPPIAGALAIARNPDGIAQLRALVDTQETVINDIHALAESQASFHELLVELHGNQTLNLLVRIVHDLVRKYYVLLFTPTGQDEGQRLRSMSKSLRAQRKLVDLIAAGEAQAAEDFWREHLGAVSRILEAAGVSQRVVEIIEG
ncbi:MAG: GntR family transcriptional regulator [Spongiibacteraceae bacterium]